MIDDVLSDDEDQAHKAAKKKKKEQLLHQQLQASSLSKSAEDDNQIDSSAQPKPQAGSSTVYHQIKMDIDMLLESDDDDYERERNYQEDDAMIEKDLDNWI